MRYRRLTELAQPPATVVPQDPGTTASIRISSVVPGRAPRTATGPTSACPASGWYCGTRGRSSKLPPAYGPADHHASSVRYRTVSPGSTVSTGGSSGEK